MGTTAASANSKVPARVFVVAIGGPSGSGKSALANFLALRFAKFNPPLLHLDLYFDMQKHRKFIASSGASYLDIENPSAVDYVRAERDLRARIDELKQSPQQPRLVLVEGFLVYSAPESLCQLFDLRVFVLASQQECSARRYNRSREMGRGRQPQAHAEFFDELVWPSFLRNNAHVLRHAPKSLLPKGVTVADSAETSVGTESASESSNIADAKTPSDGTATTIAASSRTTQTAAQQQPADKREPSYFFVSSEQSPAVQFDATCEQIFALHPSFAAARVAKRQAQKTSSAAAAAGDCKRDDTASAASTTADDNAPFFTADERALVRKTVAEAFPTRELADDCSDMYLLMLLGQSTRRAK